METRLTPANLTPIPASFSIAEAASFNGKVGSFTDADGNTDPTKYSAQISWGDGTSSTGAIAFNGTGFDVTGTHTYSDEGGDSVNVAVSDTDGDSTTINSSAAVTEADVLTASPTIFPPTEGQAINNVTVATFTNPNTSAPASDFTATINWGDFQTSAGTVTGSSGAFSVTGSHTYADEGTYFPTVMIADDGAGTATATVTSTAMVAEADLLTATKATLPAATEGQAINQATVATFTDTNTTTPASDFTATIDWGDQHTSSGNISLNNGVFSVTGSHTYADEGSYSVKVTIRDDGFGSASANVTDTATVAEADVLTATKTPVSATEGTAANNVTVATFTDTNTTAPASDFTAKIDWGDQQTSTGTVNLSNGVYSVTGSHTYADEGSFSVKVTINDDGAGTASAAVTSTATVAEADVLTATKTTVSATEGQAANAVTVATFTDANASAKAPDFTATIDWGDLQTSTGTVSESNGVFSVTGSHTYADEGTFPVTVTIKDDGTGTATATVTSTATVAEADVLTATKTTIPATEGQVANNATVATFTDSNPSASPADFTATIDWGDQQTSSGTITESNGVFSVTSSHSYADEGSFAIKVTIKDDGFGTASATVTSTATVAEADVLTATNTTITATERQAANNVTVATFTDTNPSATASDFTATIDWGDQQTSSGTVSLNNGVFSVTGSHTYADEGFGEGVFLVKVTIKDDAPGTAMAAVTSPANVAEADVLSATKTTVAATEGQAASNVTVATFTDTDTSAPASDFTARIDWGDQHTSTGTVSLSNGVFSVTGSHTYADEGSFPVKVTVKDDGSGTASAAVTSTATVAEADVLTATKSTVTATEGQGANNVTVATFTDTNPNASASDFTATIDWGDQHTSSGTVTLSNGVFSVAGSHTYTDEGTFPVKVTIEDDGAGTAIVTVTDTATVAEGDVLTATKTTVAATEGQAASNVTVATFADTNVTALASDFTASIDWGDGTTSSGTVSGANSSFSVAGSHTYSEDGSYAIKVHIADDAPGTATVTVTSTANVAEADLSVSGAVLAPAEGVALTGVTTATFSDPGSPDQSGSYTATINWGDGTTSTGTITGSAGSFTVSGDHTYTDEGSFTVKVKVTETGVTPPATATSTTSVNVVEADTLTATATPVSATEGIAFSGAQVATFTTTNTSNVAGDFTASIDWGDGKPATTGTIQAVSGSPGHFTVTGGHTYAEEGSQPVSVTIKDDIPGIAAKTVTANATIADAALTATAVTVAPTEGASFTGVVATFTDANPNGTLSDFTATIKWGDGTTSTGTIGAGSSGGFTVTGTHTYAEEGTNTVHVDIHDVGGASASADSTANVADAALMAAGVTVTPTEGASFTGVIATFTDANPSGTTSDFTATINWGDGTTSTGTIAAGSSGGFTVTGTHTYTEEGTNTVHVDIHDVGGASASADSTANVADAALTAAGVTVTPTEGTSFTGIVATFTDANPNGTVSDFTATINWGDGATSTGTVAAASGGGFSVTGMHTYAEEGTESISVTIHDTGGASATANSTAKVADAALNATAATITTNDSLVANSVTVATFTDAGGPEPVGHYTATINWGDGTPVDTGTISLSGSTFTVKGSHSFAVPGKLSATVTITDEGGSTTTVTDTVLVGTLNQRFVAQVYLDLLHRQVDSSGLSTWTGLLNQGTSPNQVVLDIEASNEYLTDVVEGFYHLYLNRDADGVGLSADIAFLANGGTEEQLQGIIVGSAEYFQTRGGSTNDGWLDALYHDAFNRTVDSSGRSTYDAALASGASRTQVADAIFTSQEYYQDLVGSYYPAFLNRKADSGGQDTFVKALQSGATNQEVIAAILSSPEFFSNL